MRRTDPKAAAAWWDDTAKEWVHGARDAEGRLAGEVRYWDGDGVLISTAEHVAGKPHGIARRFYPNGDVAQEARYVDGELDGERLFVRPRGDVPLPPELRGTADRVAAYVCLYEHGDLIGTTWRDVDGREVDQHGQPVRARPAHIEPTAFPMSTSGWIFMRRRGSGPDRVRICREYYEDGTLKHESLAADGSERAFYPNGRLAHEGTRDYSGERHVPIGKWRIFDANGRLRCVVDYAGGNEARRSWHRTAREAKHGAVERSGPVDAGSEVGVWTIRTAAGATAEIDLGPRMTDADLLAHAVTADLLDDAIANDRTIVGMLARARRAGADRDLSQLGLDPTPAWRAVDDDTGKLVPLASQTRHDGQLVGLVHALRWGPADGGLLARIADALLRGDRAQAALDVIDAALLVRSRPEWTTTRIACLRAAGHTADAERVVASPATLDSRALELLDEIRAHPDDDGPRLVFADHVANRFPAHTALIVAQCTGKASRQLERAFLATLPPALGQPHGKLVRGFFDDIRYFEAEQFVTCDPDLVYRVAPTSTALQLTNASGHIAHLVTMPALRRYTQLGFTDTYLGRTQTEQLARCPHLEALADLGLYCTALTDEDLLPILQATAWPRLASLDIGNGRDEQDYTLDGLRPIADAPFAATLRTLVVSRRWFEADVVDVLATLPALADLDLSCNRIGDRGVAALARMPNRFVALQLEWNEIGPAGARSLAAAPGFAELKMLGLERNPIGDDGVIAIARAPLMRHLEYLDIDGTGVADAGALALCDAETHPKLSLRIGRATLAATTRQRLLERFGTRVHIAG